MSFKPYWNLCTLGLPEEDGVYDVKIRLKGSCLNPELDTRLEFKNGEWVDYTGILEKNIVIAWRPINATVTTRRFY